MSAWVLSSGQTRSCLQTKSGSGRTLVCLQGELAGSITQDLRMLKRFLHSRAIAEQGQMRIHSDLVLQIVVELGSKLGVIHWELPAKTAQGVPYLWAMIKGSASPYYDQVF